jgi:hypothetical protein
MQFLVFVRWSSPVFPGRLLFYRHAYLCFFGSSAFAAADLTLEIFSIAQMAPVNSFLWQHAARSKFDSHQNRGSVFILVGRQSSISDF